MNLIRPKLALLLVASTLALPAHAAPGLLSKFVTQPATPAASAKATGTLSDVSNFSDGWWVPAESGWGINILQQGNSLVLLFYIFDDDKNPVWFRGVTSKTADGDFRGTVFLDTGTSYRDVNFGPIPSPSESVGQVRFQPTSLYDGVLTYTIGTTTASKTMTRIAFAPENFSAVHASSVAAKISSCGEKTGNMNGNLQTEAVVSGDSASMTLRSGDMTCVVSGPFTQRGKLGQIAGGTYSCTDGSQGAANVDGWESTGGSFSAIISTSSGTCTEWGQIAGVRSE